MRALPFVSVVLFGCVSAHEAAGDLALKNGDRKAAIGEYQAALSRRPIMDYEYERLRDKRVDLLEGEWGPKTSLALKDAEMRRPLEAVKSLLTFRAEARKNRASLDSVKRVDAVMLATLDRWSSLGTADVPGEIDDLLALVETAQQLNAEIALLQRLGALAETALMRGLPPAARSGGRERLELLIRWRVAFRKYGAPEALDHRLGEHFAGLTDAQSFAPATVESAQSSATSAWELRGQARELDTGPEAIALADAIWTDAERALLAEADRAEAAHHFVAAAEGLRPWAARVAASSPIRARLVKICEAGVSWHRAEAAKTTGYRQLLHLSVAESLGATGARAQTLASLTDWKTTLTYQAELAPGECAKAGQIILGAFPTSGTPGKLKVVLKRCPMSQPDRTESRSASYQAVETWDEQETVQVGTNLVRVESGSHKEQCSKPAGLDGYTWTGVCTVQDYENKQVPVFETRTVKKSREVTRSLSYSVVVHAFQTDLEGEATLLWEDGTSHVINISGTDRTTAETYEYTLPGSTPVRMTLPAGFSGASTIEGAARAARADLEKAMLAMLRQLRAESARKTGAQALAAGDRGAAADAFIRSVMIDGKAEGEAARFLTSELATSTTTIQNLLASATSLQLQPTTFVEATAAKWTSAGFSRNQDDYDRVAGAYESDVSTITSDTYKGEIMPPNEFLDAHVGIVPGEIQLGDALGSRVALQVGFDGHYSFLEMLGLRYGFAVHDEALGLRVTIGVSTAKGDEYENGESETGFAWSIDAAYMLVAGLRLPWFSVMVGGRAGYQHYAVGGTLSYGFHLEPAVRVGLRLFNIKQLILEASGLVGIPGVAHKNRVAISFPLLGENGWDLMFSAEETVFNATQLGPDGVTQVPLGLKPAHMIGVQIGARL